MNTYQLIIIGGGASGLAAAVTAGKCGLTRTAILEKLPRTGKKLLATGNGRCNLSHEYITSADYQGSVPVEQILADFGDGKAFFSSLGLHTRTDAAGRMYPYSMTAASVLDALRFQQEGVQEFCGQEVTELFPRKKLWCIRTAQAAYVAEKVIFAAGGYAAPKFGTDGSAWELLRKLQIPLVPAHPILCPVRSDAKRLKALKGLRVKGTVTLYDQKTPIRTETGEIQFTETALSGICLFNLSGLVNSGRVQDFSLVLDCIPEENFSETLERLRNLMHVRCHTDCENLLTGLVQKPLARLLLKDAGIQANLSCKELTSGQCRALTNVLHSLSFPVTGLGDFTQAQATSGGVPGSALDAFLQVKAHPGLYITGEAADVHADCGGYHLHWCWASGIRAASHAAEQLTGRN